MSNASNKNARGYEMVTTFEDLLGRLLVANECKVSQNDETANEGIFMAGFPYPADATNEQLNLLQPFYVSLLQNIFTSSSSCSGQEEEIQATTTGGDNNCILNRLDESEDQAILLLYVIEFPLLVLAARADVSGWSKCNNREHFVLADTVRRILSNANILRWCRALIVDPGSTRTISVITSAINILSHVANFDDHCILAQQKATKMIRRHIFRGEGDDHEGFRNLRDDLARILATRDGSLTCQLVIYSIQLQTHILHTLYGEDQILSIMARAEKIEIFEQALFRVKDDGLDEVSFQSFRLFLGCTPTNIPAIAQVPHRNRDETKPVYICANIGCNLETTKRCDGCKCVGYCSRECQVEDWKAGHKKVCKRNHKTKKAAKGNTKGEKAVQGSAEAARKVANHSSALTRQNHQLEKNPHCDYVIFLPKGQIDLGVQLPPTVKTCFQAVRSKASPQEPRYVQTMYDILIGCHPEQEELIRNQLLAEYGVDPESDDAHEGGNEDILEALSQILPLCKA